MHPARYPILPFAAASAQPAIIIDRFSLYSNHADHTGAALGRLRGTSWDSVISARDARCERISLKSGAHNTAVQCKLSGGMSALAESAIF
jgi:hypothetical protein